MKAKELRELTDEELRKKETDLSEELFNLKFRHTSGQAESPSKIKQVRRERARIITILNQRAHSSKTANV